MTMYRARCGEIPKEVRDSWPLAYAEWDRRDKRVLVKTSLLEHSRNVGEMIGWDETYDIELKNEMIKRRLAVLENRSRERYEWDRKEIYDFAYMVGLYHDLGKSSKYYIGTCDCEKSRCYSTYRLHEMVSAILMMRVLEAPFYKYKGAYERRAKLLAMVVARHHAAMHTRHPRRIINEKSELKLISDAINRINAEVINNILKDRRCSKYWFCKETGDLIKRSIEEKTKIDNLKALMNLGSFKGHSYIDYILVSSLTGLLIVVDNIVAWRERSGESDPSKRPYIGYWIRELGIDENIKNPTPLWE